jgi:hypothetical protein
VVAAIASAALSLLLPGPVVAVASDGPYVAVAEGRSARDCDRISIWITSQKRVVKLGRKTSCETTSTGTGIASVTIARNRALWLHYTGGNIREWSLWTATTTVPAPRRLAFATGEPDGPAPIVIGGGDYDRRLGYGDGDALPYAVGRKVVVLTATGARSYTWDAPSRVTALESEPGVVVVAVEDGRVFTLEDGVVVSTYPGTTAATSVGFIGGGVATQRGRTLEVVSSDGGTKTSPLRVGERAVFGSGWSAALLHRGRIRVVRLGSGPGGPAVADVAGTAAALDGWRFTYANGRRVTTRLFPEP